MKSPQAVPNSRPRLIGQFVAALAYLAMISGVLAELTGVGFVLVFAAVMAGIVFTGTATLAWATAWALRDNARQSQISILTMLFLTLLAAVYLGAIRWLTDAAGDRIGGGASFVAVAAIGGFLTLLSLPFVILLMESLVWFAVWLVRRR